MQDPLRNLSHLAANCNEVQEQSLSDEQSGLADFKRVVSAGRKVLVSATGS